MLSALLLVQLLNSLSFGMLLFILALGLSLIFGVARVVNLAHGALYVAGAYLGMSAQAALGSFWLALLVVPPAVGVVGALLERLFLRRLHGRPLEQVLVTLGLAFVIADLLRAFYGAAIRSVPAPAALAGPVEVLGLLYPSYQLFVLAVGVALLVAVRYLLQHTALGLRIRGVTADPEVAASMGINPGQLHAAVFGLGSALAALGGILGAPMVALAPGLDAQMTLLGLIVVVVGGPGQVGGSFWSALLVGLVDGFGRLFLPQLALFLIFGLMAIVLAFRPGGLLGTVER